ncbi:MAG: hypothetical protein DRH11_11065 [Deltaproteobacteria bacterium]|nr:MAG: hypothetical protein DRH11_11065 [Deltaproteobacteria bacterium]
MPLSEILRAFGTLRVVFYPARRKPFKTTPKSLLSSTWGRFTVSRSFRMPLKSWPPASRVVDFKAGIRQLSTFQRVCLMLISHFWKVSLSRDPSANTTSRKERIL